MEVGAENPFGQHRREGGGDSPSDSSDSDGDQFTSMGWGGGNILMAVDAVLETGIHLHQVVIMMTVQGLVGNPIGVIGPNMEVTTSPTTMLDYHLSLSRIHGGCIGTGSKMLPT